MLVAEGELDLASAPGLKWSMLEAVRTGCQELVLDLSKVDFMDSTALGVLVAVGRGLEGHRIALVGLQPDVRRLLAITGLEDSFATFGTVDEALGR